MVEKKEMVLTTKVYVNGKLTAETAKVVTPGPDYLKRVILAVGTPLGFWVMIMQGMFRG